MEATQPANAQLVQGMDRARQVSAPITVTVIPFPAVEAGMADGVMAARKKKKIKFHHHSCCSGPEKSEVTGRCAAPLFAHAVVVACYRE